MTSGAVSLSSAISGFGFSPYIKEVIALDLFCLLSFLSHFSGRFCAPGDSEVAVNN